MKFYINLFLFTELRKKKAWRGHYSDHTSETLIYVLMLKDIRKVMKTKHQNPQFGHKG
jgi:hypothetical protein